jgi:2-octaprenyl-6-methoxyphenol hydroxylase
MLTSLKSLSELAEFDIVIVGAGMVGASAAIGLKQLGLRVLLLDAFAFSEAVPAYTPSYDERSTALSWGTKEILEVLSVWQEVGQKACPISEVHVSEKHRFATARIHAQDYQQDALGYVVPNQWLGRCLLSRVQALDVPLIAGVKVTHIEVGSPLQLTLQSTSDADELRKLKTRLLIIADGSESETARLLGIEYHVEAYQQHAIIANVTTELANQGRAFERFTATGPLAFLPLTEHECAIVWTQPQEDVDAHMAMSDEAFCRALEDSFGERLGRIEHCGQRANYPLKLIQAKEHCRAGVLLLGNAAHGLHPVAGQGFNLAIRGVAACVDNIAHCLSSGKAFEHLDNLHQLCQKRQLDQSKTIVFSDQLVKIFGHPSRMLGVLRELGLVGLDNTPFLKSLFAARAMGLAEPKAAITHAGEYHDR